MNPLNRLLSLVRKGDTVSLEITGTDNGAQLVLTARLKGHAFDPEKDTATNNLVRELTYPHLVQVDPNQSVEMALDKALDTLSGAQAEGLAKLSELDQAASRLREATAAAGKAKAKPGAKTENKATATAVTVAQDDEDGDAEASGTTARAEAPASVHATAPAEPERRSVFDPE